MTLRKFILMVVLIVVASLGYMVLMSAQTHSQPLSVAQNDKYDGDCTGQETVGRCADKCPSDNVDGTYYLQGYDKETGAAICKFSYSNPCPYADAVAATDPVCTKLAYQAQEPSSDDGFVGK